MRRRLFLGLVCLFLFVPVAEAQVTVRFYLVPKVVVTLPFGEVFVPKYTQADDLGAGWNLDNRWSAMDYGLEELFLLGADVTPAEHTLLNAQVDVIAIPSPITANVSAAALSVVQSRLEGANLPGNWVTTAFTYQEVLAIVGRVIAFSQTYDGLFSLPLFRPGMTMGTRINELTQAERSRLSTTAQVLGLDYSGVTSTTTMRQVLKIVADQMPGFTLRGVQF